MKKILLLIIGFIFLGLGGIGIFIPVLPTTPFVIVSSLCFASSSKKMSVWLEKNPYFGSYIENYRTNQGVPYRIKKRSIMILWLGLTISMAVTQNALVSGILVVIGIGVTMHLISLKTKEEA